MIPAVDNIDDKQDGNPPGNIHMEGLNYKSTGSSGTLLERFSQMFDNKYVQLILTISMYIANVILVIN